MNQDLCQEVSTETIELSLEDWLKQQAITKDYQLRYVLAHAEDGVIWGHFEVESGILETSKQAFPEYDFPTLRLSTLQQCRIFGEAGEVLLWNSNGKWRSRLILQSQVSELLEQEKIGLIPESQILWGTQGKANGNFTLLSDGSQGLKYAAPITGINYWHKGNVGIDRIKTKATEADIKDKQSQYTEIKPIQSGVSFEFTIYFENLSDVELGALLWVLTLSVEDVEKVKLLGLDSKEKYRLSLGMGKAIRYGCSND